MDKAPGLWQYCWDLVKSEVMGFSAEFYKIGTFERNLNATFMALIPKKGRCKDLKDFKSISLVGGYTTLEKVLGNKLKRY